MDRIDSTLRLSLLDVSLLARVQRPVVSMWRLRSNTTAAPFPAPVGMAGDQELFDAGEVVSWLQLTGRGNNPQAAGDAAAFASEAREHFEVVSALLVLRATSGRELGEMAPEDVLDLADELDPDDEFLFSELEANASSLEPLLAFSDQLTEAAFGSTPAFEKLMKDRSRTERLEAAFTPESIELLAEVALSLAGNQRAFSDATPGGSDVLMSIADKLHEADSATLGLAAATRPDSRLALRRLCIHTFSSENLRLTRDPERLPGLVTIAHFPAQGHPALTDFRVLSAIDEISLDMDTTQAAVILAPASVLTDALTPGEPARIRESLLRSGKIRAAVRLPAGLLTSKPRQPMALWVLGKERVEVPIAERWTMVADVSAEVIDTASRHDLVADLLASMQDSASVHARAFRFARFVQTGVLLAGDGNLCQAPRSMPIFATTDADAASLLVRVESEISALNTARGNAFLGVQVELDDAVATPAAVLGNLLQANHLRLIPGTRLDPGDVKASGGFIVLGLPELRGRTSQRHINRLTLASGYARAQLTEPGDVVFSTVGGAAAMVDRSGACVVEYPARILRINSGNHAGLIASVLAHDIRSGAGGPWRRWLVKRFPQEQLAETVVALDAISRERQAASDRVAHLDRLSALLIEGSATAALRITQDLTHMEGNN